MFFILVQPVLGLEDNNTVIELNNVGIKALNKGDTKAAIDKFEAALRKDPSYRLAQDNLSIAHNNYVLQLRNTDAEQAIEHFHAALFYKPNNLTTKNNLESTIRAVGKDPKSFKDRVALGDNALKENDYMGAKLEYEAALSLEEESDIQKKLKTAKEMLAKAKPVDTAKKKPSTDISQVGR